MSLDNSLAIDALTWNEERFKELVLDEDYSGALSLLSEQEESDKQLIIFRQKSLYEKAYHEVVEKYLKSKI